MNNLQDQSIQVPSLNPDGLLALIPAYNEGKHILQVVQKTLRFLPVLVVDDGSSDETANIARSAGAAVIRQIPNQGKGAALQAGFRYALENRCSGLVMLDADGQHNPQEIEAFLDAYKQTGADLIVGKRDFSHMPAVRRATNTIGTWLFSWAIGQPIADNQSGYRLLSRRMIEAMLESKETSFEFEVEMIVVCIRSGYQIGWVPISTIYGDERSHIRPLQHVYHFLRMIWQTRMSMRKKTRL